MNLFVNAAQTHDIVLHLVERVNALEAEIATMKMADEPADPSGLLEASGLADLAKQDAKARKAEYMREYMAKKRAEKRTEA